MPQPPLIILQGPTGVGKTDIALTLAQEISAEIVNADSMQVYRYMDIGTSKPSHAQQQLVPHHLFSIINPDEHFNAARYMDLARATIGQILARGKVPLVVGGTGLYIKALTRGLVAAPDRDETLRNELRQRDNKTLLAELERVDPHTARRLTPNDTVRIIRALEVFYLTGCPLSDLHRRHRFEDTPYRYLTLTLLRDRHELYQRIERRVDSMIEHGFEDEVRMLLTRGFSPQLRPLQSIGYRQMVAVVQGTMSREAAIHEIKKETRRFAKRQLTWFRHDNEAQTIMLPDEQARIAVLAKNFLNNQ